MARPRLTVVTLGVGDLDRASRFYQGLGFAASPTSTAAIIFLDAGGLVLGLYARTALAEDALVPDVPTGFAGVTLAWNVASEGEVVAALDAARDLGATILKPARKVFWGGFSGYFADPDGHIWEVAHNPFWRLDANGAVLLPMATGSTE